MLYLCDSSGIAVAWHVATSFRLSLHPHATSGHP